MKQDRIQNINMDYVSTVVKKTSVYHNSSQKISITHRTPIRSVLQHLASLYTLFEQPFLGGYLGAVIVKGVRRCSATSWVQLSQTSKYLYGLYIIV